MRDADQIRPWDALPVNARPGPSGAFDDPGPASGPRGAVWALVVMPLVMLVVQYGVGLALAKVFESSLPHLGTSAGIFTGAFSEGGFVLLGLGLSLVGLWIVYNGTQDAGLTVGYFAVQWITGLAVTTLVTSSFFGGALTSPLLHALARIKAELPTTAAAPANQPPFLPSAHRAANQQFVTMSIESVSGSAIIRLTALGPAGAPYMLDRAQTVPLMNSTVRVSCVQGNGTRMSFSGRWSSRAGSLTWPTSSAAAAAIAQCGGRVRLPHGRSYALATWRF
jgi:hypothetical protein